MNFTQMYLETHFQHEFSLLGRFGQSGQKGKNSSILLKYANLQAFFSYFHGHFFLIVASAQKVDKHNSEM